MQEFVSIIIPSLNASGYIDACLKSIAELDYPKDRYEIILVDNGSVDDTIGIARRYDIRILTCPSGTVSRLRNIGSDNAKGDVLAFLDADCVVPANWLKDAVRLLREKGIGAAGCWYKPSLNPTLIEKAWDLHMGNRRNKNGPINWIPSGNLIIQRKVFREIGGFNESLITAEDVNICGKIRQIGYIVLSNSEIAVMHLGNPKTIGEFFVKQYWHGKGGLQILLRDFPKLSFDRAIIFSLSTFFLSLSIMMASFTLKTNAGKMMFLILIAMLVCLLLSASLRQIIKANKYSYIFLLPMLFFIFGISRAMSLFEVKIWKNAIGGFITSKH